MTDIINAARDALDTLLRADAAVRAEFPGGAPRIYKKSAPVGSGGTYIVIGRITFDDDATACGGAGELSVQFQVYALEGTPDESQAKASRMAFAVKAAANVQLSLNGHTVDEWFNESVDEFPTKDALTAHYVVTQTYLTTEDD